MAETLFDRFVFVDWSARSVPNTGRDSVWIADGNAAAVHTYNPSTREAAVERLRGLLTAAVAQNEQVLVGFDFPYGYPAGFADALGLVPRDPPWRRTWTELRRLIQDDRENGNNRFEVAEYLNERLGRRPGPFWGCFTVRPNLSPHRGAFPHLAASGVELPEIWPRVIDVDPASAPSGTLDEAQVMGLVQWASALDAAGGLPGLFAPNGLTAAEATACVAEEGWILGVT